MDTRDRRVERHHVGTPVAMVHWPRERARRDELAGAGVPRLLLIEPDAGVPAVAHDEDWIRLPADERDVAARLAALRDRTDTVTLDGRVLQTSRGTITLSPTEAAAVGLLLPGGGALVSRAALERALAAHVHVTPRTLDGVVHRVRRRLRPLGLDLFSSRGQGYTLGPRLDWPVDDADLL